MYTVMMCNNLEVRRVPTVHSKISGHGCMTCDSRLAPVPDETREHGKAFVRLKPHLMSWTQPALQRHLVMPCVQSPANLAELHQQTRHATCIQV